MFTGVRKNFQLGSIQQLRESERCYITTELECLAVIANILKYTYMIIPLKLRRPPGIAIFDDFYPFECIANLLGTLLTAVYCGYQQTWCEESEC